MERSRRIDARIAAEDGRTESEALVHRERQLRQLPEGRAVDTLGVAEIYPDALELRVSEHVLDV
jgi:hypothetical protein